MWSKVHFWNYTGKNHNIICIKVELFLYNVIPYNSLKNKHIKTVYETSKKNYIRMIISYLLWGQ